MRRIATDAVVGGGGLIGGNPVLWIGLHVVSVRKKKECVPPSGHHRVLVTLSSALKDNEPDLVDAAVM